MTYVPGTFDIKKCPDGKYETAYLLETRWPLHYAFTKKFEKLCKLRGIEFKKEVWGSFITKSILYSIKGELQDILEFKNMMEKMHN